MYNTNIKNINKLKAIKSVYSFYFPETRDIVSSAAKNFPHDTLLKSVFPGLDGFHLKTTSKYLRYFSAETPALKDYGYRYVTNGSSEGIFHLLVWIKNNHPGIPIYTFRGEYEGYREYSKNIGLEVIELDYENLDPDSIEQGFWFISNPSAINGNIIPNEKINSICKAGHRIIYDLAYLGMTKPHKFDLSNPNIIAVVTSMSKPFGLFYYRVGFAFTRFQMNTLYPNIWFKNIFSIIIADKVLSKYNSRYFYKKYAKYQKAAINKIFLDTGIKTNPSDVILLSYIAKGDAKDFSKSALSKFLRNKYYRFCLTPYFLEM